MNWKRYLSYINTKDRWLLIFSVLLSIAGSICLVVPYIIVYRAIAALFHYEGHTGEILKLSITAAVFISLRALFSLSSGALSHLAAFHTLYNVRKKISDHIGKVYLGFYSENSIGEIKKVLMEDVERIEKFIAHQIPDVMTALFVPIILFLYMASVHLPMALCMLIPFILGMAVQTICTRISGRQMEPYQRLLAKLNSSILQFIQGMPVLKMYNLSAEKFRDYSDTVEEFHVFWKKCTRAQGYTYGLFVTIVESSMVFIIPIGGVLCISGHLEPSYYLFFLVMSLVFLSSLLNLMGFATIFPQIFGGIHRIAQILTIPEESEGTKTLTKEEAGEITFENVSFRYREDLPEVLKDVSLRIPAGSLAAFVGHSGAGKTTAAQLALRFWDCKEGRILIGGTDIRDIRIGNRMDLISFVFQDSFLTGDSIYENIRMGDPSASRTRVIQAAQAAQIHDFIESLPDGYDTRTGDGGMKLSGGQRQRICIARAILKDAPIIILDEATSYTDLENERKIQKALGNLLQGKTVIMIAHRLNTIKNADQIFVFEEGRLVEAGTHKSLITKNGSYHQMWDIYQKGEAIE